MTAIARPPLEHTMDCKAFYQELYRLLGGAQPLGFDCGRLCGAACCSPKLPGMYLFPGEEALFTGLPGFVLSQTEMPGYGPVWLLSCTGTCNRELRPLSCRIFPLAPKVSGSAVRARLDPRGRPVCPLCVQPVSALSARFVTTAETAFAMLLAAPETAGFLSALSARIDEYEQPILRH
jgi:hypothetical protein